MTLAETASPARLASWNLCVLGVAVAGDTMHAEFVPMSQCRHLAIVACVDSLFAIHTLCKSLMVTITVSLTITHFPTTVTIYYYRVH